MNKLFSYSKIAAFSVIFLLIIQIAFIFVEGESMLFISKGLNAIYCMLWIVLFGLIVKQSVKTSPLVTPSFITGAGYVLSIVSIILFVIGYIVISEDTYNYQWYVVANIVNIVAMAATVIGFIWLSKFFAKGSPQKTASIIIPIVIAADFIVSTFLYKPWTIEDESKRILAMHIRSIIDYVVTYGSAFFFMFSLSKLKK